MVYTQVNITIPASGQVRCATVRTPATWVLIQAVDDNSTEIYVGGADPTSAATKQSSLVSLTNKVGIKLIQGAAMLYPYSGAPAPYDLHEMWVGGTSGDDFSVTYLTA